MHEQDVTNNFLDIPYYKYIFIAVLQPCIDYDIPLWLQIYKELYWNCY